MSALLLLIGLSWGLGQTLTKVAVSTGNGPLGLVFWQMALGALALSLVQGLRRRPLPRAPAALRLYLVIALLGTLLPGSVQFLVYRHLPAGVMSLLIATVPMFAFPLALALGSERFQPRRLLGLALGLAGVGLIVAGRQGLQVPQAGLWLLLGLVAPLLYAVEVNYVARFGTLGLGGIQVLQGALLLGTAIALPLALASGQFFWPDPGQRADRALLLAALLNAGAYALYVQLARQAGATFAAQASYLVTAAGLGWAMTLLGERYPAWIWLALVAVLAGVALVRPRPREDMPAGG